MNKEQRSVVVEYVSTLSEDELRLLTQRLTDRLQDDIPEALNMLSQSARIDQILVTAGSAWELFDFCDKIREVCTKECKRRGVPLKM